MRIYVCMARGCWGESIDTRYLFAGGTVAKKKGIDWDSVGLGEETDRAIADRVGCSNMAVYKARTKRKIKPYGSRASRCPFDWSAARFGEASDREIAALVGCSRLTVFNYRKKHGISESASIDWDAVLDLGAVPDRTIAERIGCSIRSVGKAREKRGISSWRMGRQKERDAALDAALRSELKRRDATVDDLESRK